MNKTLVGILSDPVLLDEYIQSLENDINNTEEVDVTVDAILKNILENLNQFKDRRAMKSSTIDAITNLLRFKSELPQKRIQSKKTIMDIACKKEELAIKKSLAISSESISNNTGSLIQLLFDNLDKNAINPIITEMEISDDSCLKIIDHVDTFIADELLSKEEEEEPTIKNVENEILLKMEEAESSLDILKLQRQLEVIQQFDTTGDNDGEKNDDK